MIQLIFEMINVSNKNYPTFYVLPWIKYLVDLLDYSLLNVSLFSADENCLQGSPRDL